MPKTIKGHLNSYGGRDFCQVGKKATVAPTTDHQKHPVFHYFKKYKRSARTVLPSARLVEIVVGCFGWGTGSRRTVFGGLRSASAAAGRTDESLKEEHDARAWPVCLQFGRN